MKLIGNLKKQVEETKNKKEAKEVIEKAGMELTNEELDQVAGGEIRLDPCLGCFNKITNTNMCLTCKNYCDQSEK